MDSGGGNTGSSDSAKPSPAETATNSLPGCGCSSASNITVRVTPTTGGQFDLQVAKTESVENLKKLISKKLKVPKERICLLHRDRQLRDGTLQENQLMDGSRLTLLPSVETGLLAQRPEQSVMQALESLNDSQVNDFLSGKAPLNLTMRLGDHMMLIQLQLSTVTPSSSRRSGAASTSSSSSPSLLTTTSRNSLASSLSSVIAGAAAAAAASASSKTSTASPPSPTSKHSPKSGSSSSTFSSTTTTPTATATTASTQQPPLIPLSSEMRRSSATNTLSSSSSSTTSSGFKFSTPLSLSARPFNQTFFPKPMVTETISSSSSSDNNTTSSTSTSTHTSPASSSSSSSSSSASSSPEPATRTGATQSPLKSLEDAANLLSKSTVTPHACSTTTATTTATTAVSAGSPCKCEPPAKPTLDTRALAEASRNLTQTLKQLSSEVLTSRSDPAEDSARSRRQGAIIESMHHHGKGVYSGTFSGTLNPALQDRFGRPKRDISTIIHILNDLLCATPQYRRHARQGHTITVEASSNSTPKQSSTTAAAEKTPTNLEFMEESVSLSRENQATRGKMEHLRLIMEERRARRRARREARVAPYTTQWSAKSESVSQPTAMGHDSVEPMETGEQPTGSEQQLCELNPPEPVVA